MLELFSFIKILALDKISGTVIVFLIAGTFFFLITRLTVKTSSVIHRYKWIWYFQTLFILLIVFGLNTLLVLIFPVTEETTIMIENIGLTLLWLLSAFFVQQALSLFFWNGSYLKKHKATPPALLITLVGGALYLIAVYGVLTVVFKQVMTGFIVSSSIVAAVIGLAMQSSLSDLIAGIAISIERPFRIGDWIETDDGTLGKVVDVNWRATQLLSNKNSLYIIPNSKISNASIHNYSMPDDLYSYFTYIHIPSSTSPVLVRRVLLEACVASEKVLNDPAPVIRVNQAGASYRYLIYVYFEDYPAHYAGKDDLLLHIWLKCAQYGIVPSAVSNEVVVRKGIAKNITGPSPEELLSRTAIFSALSFENRQILIEQMKIRTLSSGTVLFEQGSSGSCLYVIATGMVKIEISFSDKSRNIVSTLGSGEYFGEMSLLANMPRSATVIAHTDCQLLELKRSSLQPIFDQHPELMEAMAHSVAERRIQNQQMEANLSAEDFASKLNSLAGKLFRRMNKIFIKV